MLKNAFYITLITLISWGSYRISYPSNTPHNLFHEGIFMENIIQHVDQITSGPRAVGDFYHTDVQRYLVAQLNSMDWKTTIQKSTAFNPRNRTAAPIRNIIAKKAGSHPNNKDLLVMAHYDAAKFSGTGAGDDASGLAVILEVFNAFYKTKKSHINDIIVLFTDAEEIGLLGAHAFINEQLKNHDIGLIINLEARGSSGPVMMWPETVEGNSAMIEAFAETDVPLPVTTSLHYEIYKRLPNNTDLSPFNQTAKINGFNLAFIDNHFNYHTRLDNLDNLSIDTLAHQAIQLQSMLIHFSDADLSQMHSNKSMVYFSLPMIGLISYPNWLNWVLMVFIGILFIIQILHLKNQNKSSLSTWAKASLPLIIASIFAYGWCWLVLFIIYSLFPEFKDILQGFPYHGHTIIFTLLISAAIIANFVFGWFNRHNETKQSNQSSFNILVWLVCLMPLTYLMPGAGLLLWPIVFSLFLLAINIYSTKLQEQFAPIFAVLSFILLGNLLINLPIALGVKALPVIAVFLVWILALFIPIISPVKKPYHAMIFLTLPLGYLFFTLLKNDTISNKEPHPTSLSYLYDADKQQGYYYDFDVIHSGWSDDLFVHSSNKHNNESFWNTYRKPTRHITDVEPAIPVNTIEIKASKPLKQIPNHVIDLTFTANSKTEILEIYTNQDLTIHKLSLEGRNAILTEPLTLKPGQRILQYYFDGKKSINLQIETNHGQNLDWQVQSHSLDLLKRPEFKIPKRPEHQIPKPFIISDNVISVQSFTFGLDQ